MESRRSPSVKEESEIFGKSRVSGESDKIRELRRVRDIRKKSAKRRVR